MRSRRIEHHHPALWLALLAMATALVVGRGAHATEQVLLDAKDADGVVTSTLTQGTVYVLQISGSYRYGLEDGVADAECSNLPPDQTFQRNRYAPLEPDGDLLDVYVDGKDVEWQAVSPDLFNCSEDHVYTLTVEGQGQPLHLQVHDSGHSDNLGGFTIDVVPHEEVVVEEVVVPANSSAGATSSASLDPAFTYRLEASGLYAYGVDGSLADAECVGTDDPDVFVRDAYDLPFALATGSSDPLDLLVNGGAVEWVPASAHLSGCDPEHAYELRFAPAQAGSVSFKVSDSNYADNSGSLAVRIVQLPPAPTPAPSGALPELELVEEVRVDARDPAGASSLPVEEGEELILEASGTYAYGAGQADAVCSNTSLDPTFVRARYGDLAQLLLQGAAADWRPAGDATADCAEDHVYRLAHVPDSTGPLHFVVNDTYHGDNGGELVVRIYRFEEIAIGTVGVDSSDPDGTFSSPLVVGETYRLHATGTYTYWGGQPDSDADAWCAQAGFNDDPTWSPDHFDDPALLKLLVDERVVEWASAANGTGCDPDHAYDHVFVAGSPLAGLRIHERNARQYSDNLGTLTVSVFLVTSG